MNKLLKEWKQITNSGELDKIIEQSHEKPVIIFKYSLRCGVTFQSMDTLENGWNYRDEDFHTYTVDVIANRDESMAVAQKFKVIHQSPQLLMIKNGKCVYHSSHFNIKADKLKDFHEISQV